MSESEERIENIYCPHQLTVLTSVCLHLSVCWVIRTTRPCSKPTLWSGGSSSHSATSCPNLSASWRSPWWANREATRSPTLRTASFVRWPLHQNLLSYWSSTRPDCVFLFSAHAWHMEWVHLFQHQKPPAGQRHEAGARRAARGGLWLAAGYRGARVLRWESSSSGSGGQPGDEHHSKHKQAVEQLPLGLTPSVRPYLCGLLVGSGGHVSQVRSRSSPVFKLAWPELTFSPVCPSRLLTVELDQVLNVERHPVCLCFCVRTQWIYAPTLMTSCRSTETTLKRPIWTLQRGSTGLRLLPTCSRMGCKTTWNMWVGDIAVVVSDEIWFPEQQFWWRFVSWWCQEFKRL